MDKQCSVKGCSNPGIHEASYSKAKILEKEGLELTVYGARPPRRPGYVYLCDEHYKLLKKIMKKTGKIEKFIRKGS